MSTVSFEWHIDHRPDGSYVIEHECGTDRSIEYGPMPPQLCEPYLRARRDSLRREMFRRGGIKLLTN